MAIDFIPNTISSGYNLAKLNENFTKLQTALADGLSRSGGSPNSMGANLDMNGYNIMNVNVIDAMSFTINGGTDLQTYLDQAAASAAASAASATSASGYATTASGYANTALTYSNNAAASAAEAATSAASINLPATPVALNYIRMNAGLTGYEFRTPAQIVTDLGVYTSAQTDTLLTGKVDTAGGTLTGGVISGGSVSDTTSVRLQDSDAPTVTGEVTFKRATGYAHFFDGTNVKRVAPNDWEKILVQDVSSVAYIDLDPTTFRAFRINGMLRSTGAADNFAWYYSTDGGATFVTSGYLNQYEYIANATSPAVGNPTESYGRIISGGLSSTAARFMSFTGAIFIDPATHSIQSLVTNGGYGNGFYGLSYSSSMNTPASAANVIRLKQINAVNFTGFISIEGLRA